MHVRQQENGNGAPCGQGYAPEECAACIHVSVCPEASFHEQEFDIEEERAEDRLFDALYPESDA